METVDIVGLMVPVTYLLMLGIEKLWPARNFPPRRGWAWLGIAFLLLIGTVGAVVPLLPWFFGGHGGAIVASLVLALIAAIAVGVAIARFTERPAAVVAGRQIVFTMVPAAITYAIGYLVGPGISP